MNVALIISAETLASISDIVLIYRVSREFKNNADGTSKARSTIRRLILNYLIIWFSVTFDVLIKILIYLGYPVLFDSAISALTLALRARANLHYGLTLKEQLKDNSTHKSTALQIESGIKVLKQTRSDF